MALKDLKSNLRNLKFDKDTPGGGSSGLPYIKGGLPEDSPAGEYIADLARYSSNGTVRGGLFSVVSSTTDTVRISRFLNDFPKGLLFTSKQIGLAKSNPKIETGTRGDVLNTQVFSNSNLLAQISVQGTGEHIPYYGFNTNNLRNDENKYEEIVKKKSTDENRLVTLYNNKILSTPPLGIINNLKELGIPDNNKNVLFNYEGGPGSSYGDGVTFIPRVVDTTKAPTGQINLSPIIDVNKLLGFSNNKDLFNNPFIDIYPTENIEYQQGYGATAVDFIRPEQSPEGYTFGNTMAYSKLLASTPGVLQDFRQQTNASTLAASVSYFTGGRNNKGFNRETRIGLGNPSSRTSEQRDNFYEENYAGQDRVNMTPIYRRSINIPVEQDSDDVRDLIKFVIESIDNGHPDQTNRMHFRAYITNFSDNIGADWNSQRYMGRGENFYTYQGFTREVGFTFIVAAQSVQEMEKMYQKLNYLASTLHPDYSSGGFMRGTIHQLTIGEYFYRTPGIITSMNITVEDDYSWEIKMKQPELRNENGDVVLIGDQLQMELPQILKIQMSFKPIMNRLPQKGFQEPIIVSAGRNIGSLIANNYLERDDFKEVIKSFGGIPVDTDNIISKK